MSIRSRIGIKSEEGDIISIYCHWQGYPERTGQILEEHYTEIGKILDLINLGDISILGKYIGEVHDFKDLDFFKTQEQVRAYKRDRGEKNTDPIVSETLDDFLELTVDTDGEYAYLWDVEKSKWEIFDVF